MTLIYYLTASMGHNSSQVSSWAFCSQPHHAEIKVLTGLHSYWKALLKKNPFSSSLRTQQNVVFAAICLKSLLCW